MEGKRQKSKKMRAFRDADTFKDTPQIAQQCENRCTSNGVGAQHRCRLRPKEIHRLSDSN